MSRLYCIDTSSIIDMQDWYPRSLFEFVWKAIESAAGVQIIAPREVRKEVEAGADGLVDWVKTVNTMFHRLDASVSVELTRVMADFPQYGFITKPHFADPHVIALALERCKGAPSFDPSLCYVVSEEIRGPIPTKKPPKIPSVCDHYGLKHIRTAEMLVDLGIKP